MPGKKMAKIDQKSQYPQMSLTKWGDPVLQKVDKKFKEAQKLEYNNQNEEAINDFNECINLVIENESGLFLDQYLNILLHIAYCYSNINKFQESIDIYSNRILILKQENGWHSILPDKLEVLVKEDFGKEILLAQAYQDLAIAQYHIHDFEKSKNNFNFSAGFFLKLNDINSAIKNYSDYLGNLSQHYKQWNDLILTGNIIQSILGNNIDAARHILSQRFIMVGFVNLGKLVEAKNILSGLINFEKENNIDPIEIQGDLETLKLIQDRI